MKNVWNRKGISTSLGGKPAPLRPEPAGSALRLGIQVPFISKLIVRKQVSSREKSVQRIREGLKKAVAKEEGKIERVINEARKTDSHDLVSRAEALRDKLEEAACVKPRIEEFEEPEKGKRKKGLTEEQKKVVKRECREQIAAKHGIAKNKSGNYKGVDFSDAANEELKKCWEAKGVS